MGLRRFPFVRYEGTNLVLRRPTNTLPKVILYGSGHIENTMAAAKTYWLNIGVKCIAINYAANLTTIEGGGVTGDDLKLKCNTIDARPFMTLTGNGGLHYDLPAGQSVEYADAGVVFARLAEGGGGAGGVLKLKETTTPTATADYGALYTKADNHLYWQSGAGVEYDLGGA